jgi:pimeloyl-ACP methyl ester carboxylesterase
VMAQDVEGFIDQHKLGAVTLIGHSMYAYLSAMCSSKLTNLGGRKQL